jgi:hypothetical protein
MRSTLVVDGGWIAMIKRLHVSVASGPGISTAGDPGQLLRQRQAERALLAARDVAQLMDDLGYYALRTAEHHSSVGYEVFRTSSSFRGPRRPGARLARLQRAPDGIRSAAEDYAMADTSPTAA